MGTMHAEVESLNAVLASSKDQLDSILAATLSVDDYVDLKTLRATATHPVFESPPRLATPTPKLPEPLLPPRPIFQEPDAQRGLAGLVGGKRRHEEAVTAARATHERVTAEWRNRVDQMETRPRSRTSAARRCRERAPHSHQRRQETLRPSVREP